MSTPFLATKLYFPPTRLSLVARPRLVEQLQTGLRNPLTLISAPAGSGKTTLLSQWHLGPGAGTPVAWLSLDSADNDLVRFLGYLAASLDSLQPGLSDEIGPLLRSREKLDWEAVLTLLINRLDGLQGDSILALDDYHLIEDPAVHTALTFFLEHLPPKLHLVLLSRADPPLPLARLRARGQLTEIRLADLRFSVEETARFLNQVMGLGLTAAQVAALEKRTEGWIAGLQLAALSMHGREDLDGFVSAFTGSNRYIVDYLAEEVLLRQPEPLRQFLLKTSILDHLTGPLCDALTGNQDGEAVLQRLDQANLFVVPLDDERHWYRYHHLFSDLLRLRLEKTCPNLPSGLHAQASCWYEAQGMLPEALDHAISSGDMQLVARIVSSNVLMLLESERIQFLLQKIDAVPRDRIKALPWLGIARAWIIGTGQTERSLELLAGVEQEIAKMEAGLERRRLEAHIAAARGNLLSDKGDYASAISYARLANELLPEEDLAARVMNLIVLGDGLVWGERNHKEGTACLEEALALARKTGKPHLVLLVYGSLANMYLLTGRMHAMQNVCQQALSVAEEYQRQTKQPLSASAEIHTSFGRCMAEWGEVEQAEQLSRMAVELSRQLGLDPTELFCLQGLGRVLAFANRWEQASQVFQQIETLGRNNTPYIWHSFLIFFLSSILDCESAPPAVVEGYLRRVQEQDIPLPPLLKARLLLRDDKPGESITALDQARGELKSELDYDLLRVLVLRALAVRALGNEKEALVLLRQALELGEPENRVVTFVREGPAMEKLLRKAEALSVSPAFVRRLLAAFEDRRKPRTEPALPTGGLPEPLSARELEVLKLLARGSTDKQIAAALVIAKQTVHKHCKNIYGKLNVHNRTEAVARARELNLL